MGNFLSPVQSVLTILGVIFLLALLSLLVAILMETISILLNARAKRLFSAIRELLQQDGKLFDQFIRHPRFRQIAGSSRGLANAPEYLPAESFAAIFLELLQLRGLGQKDAVLSDVVALDTFLKSRYEECKSDAAVFRNYLADWFDEKMDFASGVHRTRIRFQLFFVAVFVALLFNADIIGLYSRISAGFEQSAVERATLVADNLQKLVATDPELRNDEQVKNIEREVLTAMQQAFEPGRQRAILGFTRDTSLTPWDWILRIAGYLISALLMAYGAQFWFKLVTSMFFLKKLSPARPVPHV